MADHEPRRIGLVVNPIAGLGGRVGLKGTDGRLVVQRAQDLGALPEAGKRAELAMREFGRLAPSSTVVTAPGEMGELAATAAGIRATVVGPTPGSVTGPEDTRRAVRDILEAGVDLLLFAGGDGTARDVMSVAGSPTPVLGIPAGCKMHSGVFAVSPRGAGEVAAEFLTRSGGSVGMRMAEVMDLDEEAFRADRLSAQLFGYMTVPYVRQLVQHAKAGARPSEEADVESVALDVVRSIKPGRLYLLGAGTTTWQIAERLQVTKTLLGVDAVLDGQLVGRDLNEAQALELVGTRGATIVVSVIGAQGFIFGRGNQQISARVIDAAGADEVIVLASRQKLLSLPNNVLWVDTGDPSVDDALTGYRQVRTGLGQRMVCLVRS